MKNQGRFGFGLLFLVVGAVVGCTPASGALGPTGYEQSVAKYKLPYNDPAKQTFLPPDWALDNYSRDRDGNWVEKDGDRYQAERELDENGDGTIDVGERQKEHVFDLRFVNTRDNAVIWLKVHPLTESQEKRDLEVVLENYADGLGGTGLFEQSSLFGLKHDTARQYTTFIVNKQASRLGPLAAVAGDIEIAEVEKLRLDPTHRDSKAELLFAKIAYLEPTSDGSGRRRVGLFVVGYADDAARFGSHLADFRNLISRVEVPASAVPADNGIPHISPITPAAQPPATQPPAAQPPAAQPPATQPPAAQPPAAQPPAAQPPPPPAPSAAPAPSAKN